MKLSLSSAKPTDIYQCHWQLRVPVLHVNCLQYYSHSSFSSATAKCQVPNCRLGRGLWAGCSRAF